MPEMEYICIRAIAFKDGTTVTKELYAGDLEAVEAAAAAEPPDPSVDRTQVVREALFVRSVWAWKQILRDLEASAGPGEITYQYRA